MKPEILNNDHMMFLDRALDTQRAALLTAMADAASECRTAADQAAELTETGETGLLRLVEILCAAKVQRGQAGGAVLEGTEVQILARQLGISPHQLSYVTHSGEGEGLLFYGSTILPFVDHFPKNTELYRIMTTKPQEMKEAD